MAKISKKQLLEEAKKAVDALGQLRAQMAILEEEKDKLEAKIKAIGHPALEGNLFRVTVSNFERTFYVAELLRKHVPVSTLELCEKKTPVTTVKVYARKV